MTTRKWQVLRTGVGPGETCWSDTVRAPNAEAAVTVACGAHGDTRNAVEIVKHVRSGRLYEVRQ